MLPCITGQSFIAMETGLEVLRCNICLRVSSTVENVVHTHMSHTHIHTRFGQRTETNYPQSKKKKKAKPRTRTEDDSLRNGNVKNSII